jgi:hypothetical protein
LALHLYPDYPEDVEDDLQAFLGGLACNQSIKSLAIHCGRGRVDDGRDFSITINTVFRALLPLCKNNKCLESLEINFWTNYFASAEAVDNAIMACQALKSITLSFEETEIVQNLGRLVQVICSSKHLKHITFRQCSLSEDDCIHMKNLLSNETCELELLTVLCRYRE